MVGVRLCCLLVLAGACLAQNPVRVLIVTGETDLPNHFWEQSTPFLRDVLAKTGRFAVKVTEEPRGLTLPALEGYDVLVMNYNGPRWPAAAEKAVEEFVRSGKGFFSFHHASYGAFFGMEFKERRWTLPEGSSGWRAFPDLLGATWQPKNIGHAPRHVFEVKWSDREHPISRGLEASFVANDELYHRLDLRPNARVLATAYDDSANGGSGKEEPVLWTMPFGEGRSVYLALGHDISAMHQPGFRSAFARSVEWAATGNVTLPPSATEVRTNPNAVRALVVTGGHSYPSSFYTLFEGWPDILWSHATSQKEAFNARLNERYDVLVLHDMHEQIGETEQEHLRSFVESGKGIVSIHHAIVNYTSWPWFYEEVTGGKYFTKPSGGRKASQYKEGVDFVVRPAKQTSRHPVLRGVGPLPVHDEVYRDMWHAPGITVLMETDHPLNDRPVVYVGPHPKARSVYIQLGHGDETMRHPGYRRLVYNAIQWTARRVE